MKKIFLYISILCSLAAFSQNEQFPTRTATPTEFLNGLRANKKFRVPNDTLPTADSNSIAMKNGNFFIKGGDMMWRLVVSSNGVTDTLHNIKFSSPIFDHTLILVGYDSTTNSWLYDDSISLKGPLPVNNQSFSFRGGVAGWYDNNFQTILDVNAGLNKRNRVPGNGNMFQWDSMGHIIRQKMLSTGGNDTVFALFSGYNTTPIALVTQSGGLKVSALTTIGNNFSFAPSSGMRVSGVPFIIDPLGGNEAEIMGEQQTLYLTRNYPGVPVNGGVNYGVMIRNRSTNGVVYDYPTKSNFRPIGVSFTTAANVTDTVFWVNGWGHIYSKFIDHSSHQDTFLVRDSGKIKYRTLAEIITAVGGGGGAPVMTIVTSNTTITEPADHRQKTYIASTLGSNITFTSPSSPTPGQIISVFMIDIGSGGSVTVPTYDGPRNLTTTGSSYTLQWSADVAGYIIIGSSGVGGSGTINSGATNRLTYYPSSGTTVDDLAAITANRALASDANGLPIASTLPKDSLDNAASKQRVMQVVDSITKSRNIPAPFTSGTSITVDYNTRAAFIGTLSHNAALTVSNMHAGTLVVYIINGSGGPYTFTAPGNKLLFLKPNVGDTTLAVGQWNGSAWYWGTDVQYTTSGGKETFTATASQTNFTTSGTLPSNDYKIMVFRNGVEIDFTRISNTVTIAASTVGDNIKIRWYN